MLRREKKTKNRRTRATEPLQVTHRHHLSDVSSFQGHIRYTNRGYRYSGYSWWAYVPKLNTHVSGTGMEFVPHLTGVFGRALRPYRGYRYSGYFWWAYVPKLNTHVSGTGMEFVPNLTGVFGGALRPYRTAPNTKGQQDLPSNTEPYRALRPYRTLPKTSGHQDLPSKHSRCTLVRTLQPNKFLEITLSSTFSPLTWAWEPAWGRPNIQDGRRGGAGGGQGKTRRKGKTRAWGRAGQVYVGYDRCALVHVKCTSRYARCAWVFGKCTMCDGGYTLRFSSKRPAEMYYIILYIYNIIYIYIYIYLRAVCSNSRNSETATFKNRSRPHSRLGEKNTLQTSLRTIYGGP